MLHIAAQFGHAEVVQLAIDDYKLDPTAHTKVCGHTCMQGCLAKSRASGGLSEGRWYVVGVCEHGWNWDRFIEWYIEMTFYRAHVSVFLSLSTMITTNYCNVCCWDMRFCLSSIFLHLQCIRIWPCLSLCFPQWGRTPVMLAAGKGHTGVVDMLVHKYNCSLTDVNKVSAFDVLYCQSPVGVWCHKCTSVSLPSCQCWLSFCACSQHLCTCICGRHFVKSPGWISC